MYGHWEETCNVEIRSLLRQGPSYITSAMTDILLAWWDTVWMSSNTASLLVDFHAPESVLVSLLISHLCYVTWTIPLHKSPVNPLFVQHHIQAKNNYNILLITSLLCRESTNISVDFTHKTLTTFPCYEVINADKWGTRTEYFPPHSVCKFQFQFTKCQA